MTRGEGTLKRRKILRNGGGLVAAAILVLSGCAAWFDPSRAVVQVHQPSRSLLHHRTPNLQRVAPGAAPAAPAPPAAPPPAAPGPPTPPPPPGGQFTATFDTSGDFYNRFQMHVSHGVDPVADPGGIKSWSGDHDMSCGAPETQRTVHAANHAEMFWWCAPGGDPTKGHIMTSMNTLGYSIVSFAPRQVFNNVSRVCWDQNLTDLGGRKWTMMLVVPESEYQSHGGRLDYVVPGFGDPGGPGGNQLIPSTNALGVKVMKGTMTTYSGRSELGGTGALFQVTDKAKRYRHCADDLGNGQIRVTQERDGGTRSWNLPGRFPDGPARVIFEDDNYDPPKDAPPVANPFTWHWDNITIS
jgi:hypothetical protein